MESVTFPSDSAIARIREPARWSAIFAGVFAFLAVEATFGVLGTAIFASAANPNATHPVTGMSAGIGIWMLILTIIALYVGGRTAGHLSGAIRKLDGMYHGLITFGLSIFAVVLLTTMILGSTTGANASADVASANAMTLKDIISTGGYWLFVTLLLGGWAAMAGGSNAIAEPRTRASVSNIREDVRNAA